MKRRTLLYTVCIPASLLPVYASKAHDANAASYKDDRDGVSIARAQSLFKQALEASSVQEEESIWSNIIQEFGSQDERAIEQADWLRDVLARAYSNRGNSRSRQGSLNAALGDYSKAEELAPSAVDPSLNKGVALEALGQYDAAIDAYKRVLSLDPTDPAAKNNVGNALVAQGLYADAVKWFTEASRSSSSFAFSLCNRACALFASGERSQALRDIRGILRRYPEFDDARAALVAMLWADSFYSEAESQWQRVDDPRYADRQWLRSIRRWPAPLVDAMEAFFDVSAAPILTS